MKKIIFDVINNKLDKWKEVELKWDSLSIEKINTNPLQYLSKDYFIDNFWEDILSYKQLFLFLKKWYLLRLNNFYFQKQLAKTKLKVNYNKNVKKAEIMYNESLKKLNITYNNKINIAKLKFNEKLQKFVNDWIQRRQPKTQQEIITKRQELMIEYQEKFKDAQEYLQEKKQDYLQRIKEKKQDYLQRYNEKLQEINQEIENPSFLEDIETQLENQDDISNLLNINFGKFIDNFEQEEDKQWEEQDTRTIFKKIVFQLLFLYYLISKNSFNSDLEKKFITYITDIASKYITNWDKQKLKEIIEKVFKPFNLKKQINFDNLNKLFYNIVNYNFQQVNNTRFIQFALTNIKENLTSYYQEDSKIEKYIDRVNIVKVVWFISLIIYWTWFYWSEWDEIENFKDRIAFIVDLIIIRNNKLFIKTLDDEYKYKKFTQDDYKILKNFLQQIYLLTIFTYLITDSKGKELVIGKDEKLNIIVWEWEEGKILNLLSFLAKFDANKIIDKKSIVNITWSISKKMLEWERIIIVYNKVFVDFTYIFYFINILTDLLRSFDYASAEYLVLQKTIIFEVEWYKQRVFALKFDDNQINTIYKITDKKIDYIFKNAKTYLWLNTNNTEKVYINYFKQWIKFKNIRFDPKTYEYNIKVSFEKILKYRNFNKKVSDAYTKAFFEILRGFSYFNWILTAIETPVYYKTHNHLFPIIFLDNIENKQFDENILIWISKKILYHKVWVHTPFILIFNKYIHKSKTFNLQVYFFNFDVSIKVWKNNLHLKPIDFTILEKYILWKKIVQLDNETNELKQYNISSNFDKMFQSFLYDNDYNVIPEKKAKKTVISKRLDIWSKEDRETKWTWRLDYIKLDYYLYAYDILARYDDFKDKTIKYFDSLLQSFFLKIPYIMDFNIFKLVYKWVFPKARLYSFSLNELTEILKSWWKYELLPLEIKKQIEQYLSLLKIDEIWQNFFEWIINPYLFRLDLETRPLVELSEEEFYKAIYRMLKLLWVDNYITLQYDTYINVFMALYRQVYWDEDSEEEIKDEEIMKIIVATYIKLYSIKYLLFTNVLQKWYIIDKLVKV